MKILVTGGRGFIGSHLVEKLISSGANRVYVIDDCSSPVCAECSAGGVDYIDKDVRYTEFTEKVDLAFSLASPTSVDAFQEDPIKTIETNVASAVLCCKVADCTILTSSCEAYGEQYPEKMIPERDLSIFRPWPVRFGYGIGKLAAEVVIFDFLRRGKSAYAVRLFKTFGPRMGLDGRMPSVFIKQAVMGERIDVYGIGNHITTMSYVSDTVDGLLMIGEKRPDWKTVVNLGGSEPITVLEYAELCVSTLSSSSEIYYIAMPEDRSNDPPRRLPDISRMLGLGWKQKVSIAEGIVKTSKFFRKIDRSSQTS